MRARGLAGQLATSISLLRSGWSKRQSKAKGPNAPPVGSWVRDSRWVLGVVVTMALVMVACAPKTVAPPSLPSVLKYPDFIYPVVPEALRTSPGSERVDLAWRYLQNDDLGSAEREFEAALKRSPGLFPARAGQGYVALARQKYEQAVMAFDAALMTANGYVPALVGRGQSLLALKRDVALT